MSKIDFSEYFIHSYYWICEVQNDKDVAAPSLIRAKSPVHACKLAVKNRLYADSTLEVRNHHGFLFFYKVAEQEWVSLTELQAILSSVNDRDTGTCSMYNSVEHFWVIEFTGDHESDPSFNLIATRLIKADSIYNACKNAIRNRTDSSSTLRIDTFHGMPLCDKKSNNGWYFSENCEYR